MTGSGWSSDSDIVDRTIVYWGWQRYQTALETQGDFWNDSYTQEIGFSHDPNEMHSSWRRAVGRLPRSTSPTKGFARWIW